METACFAETDQDTRNNFIQNPYLLYGTKVKLLAYSLPEADTQEQEIHCHLQAQTVF
jgi:hypothetical protein